MNEEEHWSEEWKNRIITRIVHSLGNFRKRKCENRSITIDPIVTRCNHTLKFAGKPSGEYADTPRGNVCPRFSSRSPRYPREVARQGWWCIILQLLLPLEDCKDPVWFFVFLAFSLTTLSESSTLPLLPTFLSPFPAPGAQPRVLLLLPQRAAFLCFLTKERIEILRLKNNLSEWMEDKSKELVNDRLIME